MDWKLLFFNDEDIKFETYFFNILCQDRETKILANYIKVQKLNTINASFWGLRRFRTQTHIRRDQFGRASTYKYLNKIVSLIHEYENLEHKFWSRNENTGKIDLATAANSTTSWSNLISKRVR